MARAHRFPPYELLEDYEPAMSDGVARAEEKTAKLERLYHNTQTYAWDGKKAGAGSMEITDAVVPYALGIDLRFTRPFPARNTSEFMLKPDARSTELTWRMHGPLSYPMRVVTTFVGMDRMIAPDFERGLAKLKTEVERSATEAAS